jgi:hypothetical protein
VIDARELAWAAGLFDGEGTFTESHGCQGPNRYVQHRAKLNMTDEDVVRRFHIAVGVGTVIAVPVPKKYPHYKPQWMWGVSRFEGVQAVIAMLWPFLSAPKRKRAKELLLNAKARNHRSITGQRCD